MFFFLLDDYIYFLYIFHFQLYKDNLFKETEQTLSDPK